MKVNIEELETRVNKKLIKKFVDGDYIGWCYTRKCQFENAWDEYTILARGIVTLSDGTVISRPFTKFFNLGDPLTGDIPWDEPIDVTEKIDGSLIIVSFHNGKMIVNSKGSFHSEHAEFARKWIETNLSEWMSSSIHYSKLKLGDWTYCFEAIFPEKENCKVIRYGDRADLTLLAIFDRTDPDYEFSYEDMCSFSDQIGVKPIERYAVTDIADIIEKCKKRPIREGEGLVFRFLKSGKRIKVKSDEYLRLNRIIAHLSKKHILDVLINEDSIESIYSMLPDEFYQEVKTIVNEIESEYSIILNNAKLIADKLHELPTKKERALYLLSKPELSDIKVVVFELLEGKNGKRAIWSIIRKNTKEVEPEE